jgi:hypothetical protein
MIDKTRRTPRLTIKSWPPELSEKELEKQMLWAVFEFGTLLQTTEAKLRVIKDEFRRLGTVPLSSERCFKKHNRILELLKLKLLAVASFD